MAVNPGVWGIDIGQCALKALRLEQIDGVITATAFDYVEHPKILSQPDANPDEGRFAGFFGLVDGRACALTDCASVL